MMMRGINMKNENKSYIGRACYIKGVENLSIEQREVKKEEGKTVVKITRGGICGSDIHYFYHGGVGDLKLQHPMLLGHEVIGYIKEAPENSNLSVGQKVALNPSLPCEHCQYCLEGKSNLCSNMYFFGSAMRNPHVHGGFADYLVVDPRRCIPYDNNIPDKIMVFAEPLSVGIHAVNLAGSLIGKHVLVSGAGPIGCLIVAVAKACGADTVTVFDISDKSCEIALKMGADKAINPSDETLISSYKQNKGYFDVVFDASGAQIAIQLAIQVIRPSGVLIQVGNSSGLMGIPMMDIVGKEITVKGSFRFNQEFASSVHWLESGRIDPLPLLTAEINASDAENAIRLASDKTKSAKVQLIFN